VDDATGEAFGAALSELGDRPVYLHVDVDIMDGAEVPGLRFPVGRGPSRSDIETCLTTITTRANVVAASLAGAWLPEHVGTPSARDVIAWLAGALGAQLTWPASLTG